MKILWWPLLVMVACLWCSANAIAADPLMDRIRQLEPSIGVYPPNIKNEEDLHAVKKQYAEIKSELDGRLADHPEDQELLFMRGYLQSMGHNFDYPGAWQGATDDLRALLTANPAHIPALLELAKLWVNSDPALAPEAEKLFRGAQCYKGDEPLEEAQKGIFFALYYQGKMAAALRQSEYLKLTWPGNPQYQELYEMTRTVLARSNPKGGVKKHKSAKPPMATCDK
ncbi:MAG: hypothetical protein P4L42_09410 [Desulfocapsaceae bacterium]|nr:hypothetical protein [Desulfocapsaceae bacterium]